MKGEILSIKPNNTAVQEHNAGNVSDYPQYNRNAVMLTLNKCSCAIMLGPATEME